MRRKTKIYPYVVIGGGAGGLTTAVGLAKAGKNVVLIEDGKLGGDCTNHGCVPSKALIAAGERAHTIAELADFGLGKSNVKIDVSAVPDMVRDRIEYFKGKEGLEELAKLGIDVIDGHASFVTPTKLIVRHSMNPEISVEGEKFVIATGSSSMIRKIDGLEDMPYLTNETIFNEPLPMKSLAIIGGGPMGCELGQALNRLGTKVTIIERDRRLLPGIEKDVSPILKEQFLAEGMRVKLGRQVERVRFENELFNVRLDNREEISTSKLLVVAGRKPSIEGLGLKMAGIRHTDQGIIVDRSLRTNMRHIFAVGDVLGGEMHSHLAENQAIRVVGRLAYPMRAILMSRRVVVPSVTFTYPEVAKVGLVYEEACKRHRGVGEYQISMKDVDRAIIAGGKEGFVKIVATKRTGKILGATIVAPRAGEMLQEIVLAMNMGIPLWKIAGTIHTYPSYAKGVEAAARVWVAAKLDGFLKKRSRGHR